MLFEESLIGTLRECQATSPGTGGGGGGGGVLLQQQLLLETKEGDRTFNVC